ncbi:kinase-like domain-containing protein [Aspergillus avenaceus]|uniref:Kinase-like domain-containing protein n=1 Tax=Aspergillus avenaceus TaxID=36643 RepID=A0A5N6TZZ8_ASPAV|nr:kinase-like domain-containing protein [Aspergillus avenaceus]
MAEIRSLPAPLPPDGTKLEKDFLDSTFFKTPGQQLPTPAQVRALSPDIHTHPQPKPIVFRNPNIFVKFGRYVTVAEAQCLWMVRQAFQGTVPVPELFGWRVDNEGYVFIYMELIEGQTLLDGWEDLQSTDKEAMRNQLCDIIGSLRHLTQTSTYIGSINRQTLPDYVFQSVPDAGPFPSIKEFNDWFSTLPQRHLPPSLRYNDPYREFLPDDGDVKFTHADLHRGNIMISSTAPFRVIAIVDWGQAGWYPDYWEYCKALYTCWYEDEWRAEWIDRFSNPRLQESQVAWEYTMAIGAV